MTQHPWFRQSRAHLWDAGLVDPVRVSVSQSGFGLRDVAVGSAVLLEELSHSAFASKDQRHDAGERRRGWEEEAGSTESPSTGTTLGHAARGEVIFGGAARQGAEVATGEPVALGAD